MGRDPLANVGALTREECEAVAKRVFGMVSRALAEVVIQSGVTASTNFARGDSHQAADRRFAEITLTLITRQGRASVSSNRFDDAGLRLLVAEAEGASLQWRGAQREPGLLGPQIYKTPPKLIFEEAFPLMASDGRAGIVAAALDATEGAGLIGAGGIMLRRSSRAVLNTAGLFGFREAIYGELSLTARTRNGRGSGWGWSGHEDWTRVDPKAVIARAVDLAQRSANPVAVEPGRYTVILEPAAVAELIGKANWSAIAADAGYTVFSKEPQGTNKIGLKMMDERLNIVSDPWDPDAPQSTVSSSGEPLDKLIRFEHGILESLEYSAEYAKEKGRELMLGSYNLRLFGEGPTQTLDEMIASTKRGIWVNRLSSVFIMNERTLLLTGTTRDGTFLIENGRITKAIKNFRFTESPFFVLNKLEAFGEPVRAYSTIVAPRLKVRDFDFTSLTDAV